VFYNPRDELRRVTERDLPHSGRSYRSAFRRDYARLIHSPAFRRLQGKTQLFPGIESDFFRNRLTHSLEVAQIAKSIALRLNTNEPKLRTNPLNTDLVEFAALAHDLGHPPFGHNGELALDACMKKYGGFEGNAQTFRILSRLEKKRILENATVDARDIGISHNKTDFRAGLNLSARSLAAVLKYDRKIPVVRDDNEAIVKGFYSSESDIVEWVRESVCGDRAHDCSFKTIECSIMDLADDIAYSTYDLEDTFKAGFLAPLDLLSLPEHFRAAVAESVSKSTGERLNAQDVLTVLIEIFGDLLADQDQAPKEAGSNELEKSLLSFIGSRTIATNGYARTDLTSQLVGEFIQGVQFEYYEPCPALSRAYLRPDVLRRVETVKRLTYLAVIQSPRLKVAEYRGYEIVEIIFKALTGNRGKQLLPDDYQQLYTRSAEQERVISDFIAGMTDSYAVEFYARLKSENATTIFKPF
jgi:dGTPase